jgi:hypothetical protein
LISLGKSTSQRPPTTNGLSNPQALRPCPGCQIYYAYDYVGGSFDALSTHATWYDYIRLSTNLVHALGSETLNSPTNLISFSSCVSLLSKESSEKSRIAKRQYTLASAGALCGVSRTATGSSPQNRSPLVIDRGLVSFGPSTSIPEKLFLK